NTAKSNGLTSVAGIHGNAVQLDGDEGVSIPDLYKFDRWDPFTFDFWLRDQARNPLPVVVLQRTLGTDTGYNGFDVMLDGGFLEVRLYRVWPGNGIGVRTAEPIARNEWQHLAVTYDGSSTAKCLHLYVNGKEIPTTILRDSLHKRAMVAA